MMCSWWVCQWHIHLLLFDCAHSCCSSTLFLNVVQYREVPGLVQRWSQQYGTMEHGQWLNARPYARTQQGFASSDGA
ncbi:hypothetical protein V8C86DRAFT_2917539 [Haematococcus lacustris]